MKLKLSLFRDNKDRGKEENRIKPVLPKSPQNVKSRFLKHIPSNSFSTISHSFFGPFICFRKIDWRNVGALQHNVGLSIPHLLQLASNCQKLFNTYFVRNSNF